MSYVRDAHTKKWQILSVFFPLEYIRSYLAGQSDQPCTIHFLAPKEKKNNGCAGIQRRLQMDSSAPVTRLQAFPLLYGRGVYSRRSRDGGDG